MSLYTSCKQLMWCYDQHQCWCGSVKPRCLCPVVLAAHHTWAMQKDKECSLHSHWNSHLQSFPSQWNPSPLWGKLLKLSRGFQWTLYSIVRVLQSEHPIGAEGLHGLLLGSSCIACFASLYCSWHHQFLWHLNSVSKWKLHGRTSLWRREHWMGEPILV